MGSSRLKGKSLMSIGGVSLVELLINRVKKLSFIDDILVATTNLSEDIDLVKASQNCDVKTYQGASLDVFDRFYKSSLDLEHNDVIVRFTADNPLNNPIASAKAFEIHCNHQNDYTCIDGLSHIVPEFIKVSSIREIFKKSHLLTEYDKEHVTPFYRKNENNFRVEILSRDFMGLRPDLDQFLTIDTLEDFNRFEEMNREVDLDGFLDFDRIYSWLIKNQSKFKMNTK
jgi:spore coat polysaccharide biosynthesis protein SpsF (cytidylyltransferase family)